MKVEKYSLGMKQKLNIAQAVMEHQKLLLLDEPTNGLDRESVEKFYEVIKKLKDEGSLIINASHINEELNGVCDDIIEIENGRVLKKEKE